MLGRLRGLLGRPGPVGAVALGVLVGIATGLLALNAVLAGWTFRNASRRDLRHPGRWALVSLAAGLPGFGAYVAVQWYRDRQRDGYVSPQDEASDEPVVAVGDAGEPDRGGGTGGADRTVVAGEATDTGHESGEGPGADADDDADQGSGSLARATLRYGGKAAVLGVRGARRAGRRVSARMNND